MGREGRGRGRFQGRGQGNRGHYNNTRSDEKRDISQAYFMVGTAKTASDFVRIKKYCINQFRMNYKQGIYIATAIEDGKDFDFTTEEPAPLQYIPEEGTKEEILEKQGINKSKEINYKRKMDKYNDKLDLFAENKVKAYGYLWEKCSTQMKQNIESKQDYQSKIKNNPFELLAAIEGLSYNYQESKYEIAIIFDAIKTFTTIKQKDEENLTTYMDRFKAASNNMKTQIGGEIILTKYIKTMENYDASKEATFIKLAFEELKAYAFIANSDSNKYGSLIKNLAQQQSLKNTQYPKTLTAAAEVLMEHHWDQEYFDAKKKRKEQQQNDNENNSNNNEMELSFAQLENACYCCGKKGHSSNYCYKREQIPKDQWYINKLQKQETEKIEQQLLQTTNDAASRTPSTTSEQQTDALAWSMAHIPKAINNELKDTILLDNGSTASIFGNPRMVHSIREVETPLQLNTNGGEVVIKQKGIVEGFGEVWYDSKSMANIFSFAEMKEKHNITYDSSKEDAFNIHLPNKTIKFSRSKNGLYLYKPNEYVLNNNKTINKYKEQQITGVDSNKAKESKIAGVITKENTNETKAVNEMNKCNEQKETK